MPEHLYALHYTYPPDMLERRAPHREAHLAHIAAWYADGRVIIAGATGDPASGGFGLGAGSETVDCTHPRFAQVGAS